ncbi:hypothetical protein [Paenibacillus abyssi]|uniref:Uncharacterized protein n=1 Tax=Paenibacillus abyssi TaxID=1340531 RepID=A0A917G1G2_9BACL|nr:hypothetical protein [Paenibacillus abyssi]GGG18210.1 hypothetical protein GCM10010916_38790 [Paenibacillus abyssi]
MNEVYEVGCELIYGYVYEGKPIRYEELDPEVKDYMEGWRPRLPADEFPEDFPDEGGYTGDYFTLYRGICFTTEEAYTAFLKMIERGEIQIDGVSSWTVNPGIAERFAKGAGLPPNTSTYMGLVLELSPVKREETFFASYEAHNELESLYADRLEGRDNRKLHSLHEEEIVMPPGTYQVSIYKRIQTGRVL